MINQQRSKHLFFRKNNYNVFESVSPIPSATRKLPVILDTGAEPNFLREENRELKLDQSRLLHNLFLTRQVVQEPGMIKFQDASDKPLRIIGSIKFCVKVGGTTKLVGFLVYKQTAVPAILGCDF